MPIAPDALAALAADFAIGMPPIRGRRVQRLLKREVGGADHALIVALEGGRRAVLAFSASGAAFCATDGRGPSAAVVRWLHGSATGQEAAYELLKDALPLLGEVSVSLAGLLGPGRARPCDGRIPAGARDAFRMAMEALTLPAMSPARIGKAGSR